MVQANPLYLLADRLGVAPLLAEKLRQTGISTEVTEAVPSEATHLILLPGLNPLTDQSESEQTMLDLFMELRHCAQTMLECGQLLMTVQDTDGAFSPADLHQAWIGGLAAFAKTAAREWQQLEVKAIDLECSGRDAETLAEALFQELVFGGMELEVGLNAVGERVVLEAVPGEVPNGLTPFNDHDVLVVSGGARGVTSACLLALAERQPLRFVLLGRSELVKENQTVERLTNRQALQQHFIAQSGKKMTPAAINRQVSQILAGREIHGTLDRLVALGSEVRYLSVDITDSAAVTTVLNRVRRDWGRIDGVIHAAGVLYDKAIVDMTTEQFKIVFRTKVSGLHSLLNATMQDELKLLCCFSSLAARVGNPGQLNYNAANETLNRVCAAEKARRPATVVKSIGWGAWDGGMVTSALKKYFQQLGVELIDQQAGAQAFVAELYAGPESAVEVLLTGDPGQGFSMNQPRRIRQTAVWFHEQNFPFLKDHVIRDVPVVAMFFVIELAARFAQGVSGQPAVRAVRDVKVYKGIQLPNFSTQGHWVQMTATTVEENVRQIEFRDEQDRLNYRFTVETGSPLEPLSFGQDPAAFGSSSWDWDMEVIYSDRLVLFHSGVFKIVAKLRSIDAQGFSHSLVPSSIDPEERNGWSTDILMTDGAAQGAVLWAWAEHEQHVLPSGLEEMRIYHPGLLAPPISCYTKVVQDAVNQCRFDIWLVDDKHRMVVASMKGLEMTCIPTSWIPEKRKKMPIRLR